MALLEQLWPLLYFLLIVHLKHFRFNKNQLVNLAKNELTLNYIISQICILT